MILYASTIFVSAFILFLVQPIMAKQILPWFGGSAAVWTTCMVFFQVALLVGYAYADASIRWLRPRAQALLHIGLLALSLAVLPIIPAASWKPAGDEDPTWQILGLLIATIGLPYLLLSTTGPLVQAWFARSFESSKVYRLFALSNFGSLLALIGYPFLVEPWISTRLQSWIWSGTYTLFALLCAASALYALRQTRAGSTPLTATSATPKPASATPTTSTRKSSASTVEQAPAFTDLLTWLTLSALGSGLLLAVSNHITQNIASVPFLWLLPLTLYLITFILCFEGRGWYTRSLFLGPLAISLIAMSWGLYGDGSIMDVMIEIPLYCAGLFVCCMFLHGELATMRPEPRYLTRFYLMISLGGAVGGLLVGIVAPRVFNGFWEIGVGLLATALVAVRLLRHMPRPLQITALAVTIICAWYVAQYIKASTGDVQLMSRNFYGALFIKDTGPASDREATRNLTHGQILHGRQYLHATRRLEPTTYYGPGSGIGLALQIRRAEGPVKVGVVGLGTGTLAAWGRSGDTYRFYDIDPEVIAVARSHFSYLSDSKARIDTVLGDARLQLERESPQKFDILAIDAFSSDSIPVHLITREALALYQKHVTEQGIIAFHITNRFLDLAPMVAELAAEAGLQAILIAHIPGTDDNSATNSSDWMLLTRDARLADHSALKGRTEQVARMAGLRPWTDDFSSLYQILK
ncbi:MAG: hypothetical protein RLZZ153_1122 [Pseudomonadota bacterium]|jgi:hypothetical protein